MLANFLNEDAHLGYHMMHVSLVQTLERSYLLKVNGVVVERPQHMLMRVSVSHCRFCELYPHIGVSDSEGLAPQPKPQLSKPFARRSCTCETYSRF